MSGSDSQKDDWKCPFNSSSRYKLKIDLNQEYKNKKLIDYEGYVDLLKHIKDYVGAELLIVNNCAFLIFVQAFKSEVETHKSYVESFGLEASVLLEDLVKH